MSEQRLWSGEAPKGSWTALVPFGKTGVGRTAGTLLLTDRRRIFRPLRLGGGYEGCAAVIFQLSTAAQALDEGEAAERARRNG
jgi:hypothetical protein